MVALKLSRVGVSKYKVNQGVFTDENDLSFYLLGVYCTYGNINVKKHNMCFSLTSKDECWITSIRDIICPDKPVYKTKKVQYYTLDASNIDCMNWLISYGCTPKKSKTLRIEKEIPEKYQRDFIRGVLDGDGCITSSKYIKKKNLKEYEYLKIVAYICSASKVFLEQISQMIPIEIKFTINSHIPKNSMIRGREIIATGPMHRLIFNDGNAKKFLEWIYYDGHKLSLPRKLEKAKQFI